MESQPQNHQLHSEIKNTEKIIKTDLFQGLQLHCPFSQPAYEYCCEENCQLNAVICKNDDCKCQHPNCDNFLKVTKFNQKINNKIIQYSCQDYKEIQNKSNQIIDKVSLMLDQISFGLKTFGLNQNQENLKDSIIGHFSHLNLKQNQSKLNGAKLFKFKEQQKKADKQWFEYSLKKYKHIVSETKRAIMPLFEQIESALTFMHSNHAMEQSLKNYLSDSKVLLNTINLSFQESSLQKLVGLLNDNLKIKSIKKVYSYAKNTNILQTQPKFKKFNRFGVPLIPQQKQKESEIILSKQQELILLRQQQQHAKQFFQALNGKSNLIFLVRNTYGINFGAYTPCEVSQKYEWQSDQKNQSFLFNLNNLYLQKLNLTKNAFKFTPVNIEIGQGKGVPISSFHNYFLLSLKDGQFSSEITFSRNPNPKNNNGIISGANNQSANLSNSLVEILEVYEAQVEQGNVQSKPVSDTINNFLNGKTK